jgi:hypothetical protein
MLGKINNVVRIPTTKEKFFKYWFEFLKPFHNLTNREIEVISSFVKHRYKLSLNITSEELLNKVLMSEETKKSVREDCGITSSHFQVIMSKLREKKIIIDDKINPKFIPNITKDEGNFKFMLLFDFIE